MIPFALSGAVSLGECLIEDLLKSSLDTAKCFVVNITTARLPRFVWRVVSLLADTVCNI